MRALGEEPARTERSPLRPPTSSLAIWKSEGEARLMVGIAPPESEVENGAFRLDLILLELRSNASSSVLPRRSRGG
jgi:hypothetical protein